MKNIILLMLLTWQAMAHDSCADKIYELEAMVIEIEQKYGDYVLTENIKRKIEQLVKANERKPAIEI